MSVAEQRWERAIESERQSVLMHYGIEASRAEACSYVSWQTLPTDCKALWEKWIRR